MTRKWILVLALVLVVPVLACSVSVDMADETPEVTIPPSAEAPTNTPLAPPPPTPTSAPPTGRYFYDVFFASDVTPAEEPITIADEFPLATPKIHSFASYEGMADGLECESVWYLSGEEITRTPFEWGAGESGEELLVAYVEAEDGLPAGDYGWELYVEGKLAVSGSFSVPREAPVLYRDHFSDPSSGWEVGDYDAGSLGYRDGVYFVTSIVEGSTMWGVANRSFSDLVIEVDATQVSAPANSNNAYGVMCRVQANDDGYALRISGDGFYGIHKAVGEDFEALVDWTESEAIRQGNATNHLRAVCDGADLALFVNGELVAQASDMTFVEGDIALTATTFEEQLTEVHFDYLVVFAPSEGAAE